MAENLSPTDPDEGEIKVEKRLVATLPAKANITMGRENMVVRANQIEIPDPEDRQGTIVVQSLKNEPMALNLAHVSKIVFRPGTEHQVFETVNRTATCSDNPPCSHMHLCIQRGMIRRNGQSPRCLDYQPMKAFSA